MVVSGRKWCIQAVAGVLLVATLRAGESHRPGGDVGATAAGHARAGGVVSGQLYGFARPLRQVTLSPPVAGAVATTPVEEGSLVRAGDVLVALDDRVAAAAVRAAEAAVGEDASIEHAAQAVALARSYLGRIEASYRDGASTDFELEQARARYHQAQALHGQAIEARERAKRQLDLERARLDQLSVRAPFDGRVDRVLVRQGQAVTAGEPAVTLVSLRVLEAELHLPVERWGALCEGATYRLEAAAPVRRAVPGRVSSISPLIDPATRTFRVVFRIGNEDGELPAGFAVRLGEPPRLVGVPAGGEDGRAREVDSERRRPEGAGDRAGRDPDAAP